MGCNPAGCAVLELVDMDMNYDDLVRRLRLEAEMRADDSMVAEYGPAGGNPDAKPQDYLEWIAADAIQSLQRDALRYEWLKKEYGPQAFTNTGFAFRLWKANGSIDQAIDEAMRESD